ncbi:T9SS type A sorting domain-containing protein [Dyadobacter sandarakinus]|uniref:T9SS type A sorting domain-containing protein n=1 Tax=Dyadobacter sandarakinus TaxID=2747268 RepID=A0ABX7IAL6_9BACT|nr:T9SS type A sorting domain-containing protein [Dyadobacter sandarakinus]QRR02572.1 T9SS type A sorting domain-containing protein [Dyadobacter sandarakinus]
MHFRISFRVVAKALLLILFTSSAVFSQIKITTPSYQAVYQRDITGQRTIPVTGTFTIPMDKVEVRAVPVVEGQGVETPWQDLQVAPAGGVFNGNITLYGGWYALEVRAIADGKVVGRDVLARVGVGEVFVIAGQSNAQGLKAYPGPSAVDDRVIYISNYENDELGQYHDLLTDPTPPVFSKITNVKTMSPRGQSAWCWGILGDLLVSRLNLPVMFINTAWEGTAVENWSESSQGRPTKSYYGYQYAPQMPYANLRIAAKNYINQYGVRSVLWMQGETDGAFGTPAALYRERLQEVINKLNSDTNKRITWVIARTSRASLDPNVPSKVYPQIIAAQNAVLDTKFNPTYPGPETDPLVPNRPDGIHFIGTEALTILANAWNQSLNANFFSTVLPVAPSGIPKITAACTTTNNGVTITLPSNFASYEWSTGEKSSSIVVTKAGTYRATVRDSFGNSILTSVVVLNNDAKPVKPVILQSGQQQACADSSFQFSVSEGSDIYTWYKQGSNTALATGAAARISEAGNYVVQGTNIFGCISDLSNPSSLLIREKVPQPVIEPSGPFSVTASISETGLNTAFLWRRPGTESDTLADLVKILKSGTYSVRARVTYTLNNNTSINCFSDSASREFKTNEENDVVIYPNPSQSSFVYIESRDNIRDATITLYDIFGRVIKYIPSRLINSRFEVDVSNLPTGKYIIRVTGQGQSLTKQIVIR